jgi:hypothetical protein
MIVPKRGAGAKGGSEGRERRAEARGGSEKLTFVRFYIVICNVM